MANIDVEFIKDLEQCLDVADQLAEVDTEEVRLFVSQQLQELHTFLQEKQNDAETQIEEEIKKEENEIEDIKLRIERATKSDGNSEADIAYTDFGLLWTVLKEEHWQLAFNAYLRETKDEVKYILENLIAILKASFKYGKLRAAEIRDKMKFQVYYPGEEEHMNKNLKLPKKPDASLEVVDGFCRQCQINSTPFCLPSVQQAVMSDVKGDKSVAKHFKHQSKELKRSNEKYLEKCVEFSWIACFKEPEMQLITTPIKECNNISRKFIDLDKTTYHHRKDFAVVEWPAIIQGETIITEWKLYTLNQPRPQPKNMHGETSKDYRVIGTEGKDGQLEYDPDNADVHQAKSYTTTETTTSKASVGKVESASDVSRPSTKHAVEKQLEKKGTSDTSKTDHVKRGDQTKPTQPEPYKEMPYKTTQERRQGHENTRF